MSKRRKILLGVIAVAALLIPAATFVAAQTFPDVPPEKWYYDDVEWSAANGIIFGREDGLFYPNDPITRAETTAVLHRFAQKQVSIVGSNSVEALVFNTTVSNPLNVLFMTGFDVPAEVGVLTVNANVVASRAPENPGQYGLIWIEIDNGGACDETPVSLPGGVGWYNNLTDIASSTSTVLTQAIDMGTHRIDLCTAGLGNRQVVLDAHMNVEWTPGVSVAGVAGAGVGTARTWQDMMAPIEAEYGD